MTVTNDPAGTTIEVEVHTEDHQEDMPVPLCMKKGIAENGFEKVDASKERSVRFDIMLNALEQRRRRAENA